MVSDFNPKPQTRNPKMPRIPVNALKEILARIFDGFEVEYNVSPNWLINPKTHRKLKLDLLYPEIGLAVRFQGLRAKQQRAPKTRQEIFESRKRDDIRRQLCAANGVSLATLNLNTDKFHKVFKELETAMSRASNRLKRDETRAPAETLALLDSLGQARSKVRQFRQKIRTDKDWGLYNELWRDRQYLAAEPDAAPVAPAPALSEGMLVEHSHFGLGEVVSLSSSGDDTLVTIRFEEGDTRTFMASLLGDKISA